MGGPGESKASGLFGLVFIWPAFPEQERMEAHKSHPRLVSQSVVGCDRGPVRPRPGSGLPAPDVIGNAQESCGGRKRTGPSPVRQSLKELFPLSSYLQTPAG